MGWPCVGFLLEGEASEEKVMVVLPCSEPSWFKAAELRRKIRGAGRLDGAFSGLKVARPL